MPSIFLAARSSMVTCEKIWSRFSSPSARETGWWKITYFWIYTKYMERPIVKTFFCIHVPAVTDQSEIEKVFLGTGFVYKTRYDIGTICTYGTTWLEFSVIVNPSNSISDRIPNEWFFRYKNVQWVSRSWVLNGNAIVVPCALDGSDS